MRERNFKSWKKPLPVIENDVWIGFGVTILNGTHIGDGVIIAAGSVVTKDIEPYMIVRGVPAKPIKRRFSDKLCERLEKSKWWNYGPEILYGLDISNPEECIDELESRIFNAVEYVPPYIELDIETGNAHIFV